MAFNLHGSSVVVAFFVFSPPPLLFCAKKLGYSVKFAIPLLTLFFAHASPFPIFPAREVTARPSTFSSPPPFFRDEICQTGVRPLSHLKGERGLSVTRLWGEVHQKACLDEAQPRRKEVLMRPTTTAAVLVCQCQFCLAGKNMVGRRLLKKRKGCGFSLYMGKKQINLPAGSFPNNILLPF